MSSCTYKYVEPETISLTDSVSFSTQIQPIFDANCTSCHKPGAANGLDLTAPNAYSQIKSTGLIDANYDAANSKLYTYVEPSSSTHSWEKYSDSEAQLISVWITQGAKNN